ncbi:MAG: hypothetical protein COW01_13625 [Bdellovibrionales bacterium CG12_big_fil_rev_8_21_14_0_65_38_15]|nr:MAG: hypothetical protein COW79_16445 [Bdellovibrionales bacterium CG22_combo_CG10-13_8_21_14_all_38_13]PIQ53313.1 MAG: hypothetical protein COW01_13625 [Bdellovibrionales bacterium CG12_big_fil_rev_8_21_14_0_65_38_15]PIR30325.1 MAG: hypothetical protein COV38_06135 [Bdellovibrionales bacterium CG11_big_fil_rev_8_21_14_0_20_38_13]
MKALVFIFTFVISSMAFAQKPNFLVTESAIIEEYRGALRSKLDELSQNYIASRTNQAIIWFSTNDIECNGKNYPAKSPLATLSFSTGIKSYQVELRGCDKETVLVEQFLTQEQVPYSISDYLEGMIPAKLSSYLFKDGHGVNIFEWRQLEHISSFKFINQSILDLYKEDNRWQYLVKGYNAQYSHDGFSFNVTMGFPDFRTTVEWDDTSYRIFDSEYRRIGINAFLTGYSHAIQTSTLSFVGNILKRLLDELPSTEFVSSGGQNSRFLDEMRRTLTRLLNNLELNLVRQFVQDVIKALETGLLKVTDNRPEDK